MRGGLTSRLTTDCRSIRHKIQPNAESGEKQSVTASSHPRKKTDHLLRGMKQAAGW